MFLNFSATPALLKATTRTSNGSDDNSSPTVKE